MKLYYDLHIHSALSPCGDNDMTPNNILNMAKLKGLDVIAVSDHNSAKNVRAVVNASDGEILVIPAIEVTTAEEVHALCLFENVEEAEDMDNLLYDNLPDIKNRVEIFGNQFIMDENDLIKGSVDKLLISATALSIYALNDEVKKRGGIMIPAHIDKSSYSILSNLGFMPPDLDVGTVEITSRNRIFMEEEYKNYNILTNSDAHYLFDIAERENFIEVSDKNIKTILKFLKK